MRAIRRHHIERLKKKRKFIWGREEGINDPKLLNIAANTPKVCSCYMCGNPRKWWNEITVQEKKAGIKGNCDIH